jgi:Tol biopolymer transport system component
VIEETGRFTHSRGGHGVRSNLHLVSLASAALLAGCSTGTSGPSDGGNGGGGGGGGLASYDLLFSNGDDLCGMKIDGTGKAVLKQARDFDAYDTFEQMVISPDGTKIVYAAACAGSRFLRIMGSGLGNPTDLTTRCGPDAQWPAFSPDGTRIAFIATSWTDEERGSYLYVMDVNGTGARRVTALDGIFDPGDRGPAFSADGTRILFTSGRDGNAQLWSIALDGSGPQVLVVNEGYVSDPVPHWVTVDHGSGATYHVASRVSVLENTPNVYRLSDGARVTNEPDYSIQRPAVSPDGTKLVYARTMGFATQDLQVLDVASGSAVTISAPSFSDYNADPVFVPRP